MRAVVLAGAVALAGCSGDGADNPRVSGNWVYDGRAVSNNQVLERNQGTAKVGQLGNDLMFQLKGEFHSANSNQVGPWEASLPGEIDREAIQLVPFTTQLNDGSGGTLQAMVTGAGRASNNRIELDLRISLTQREIVYSFTLTR